MAKRFFELAEIVERPDGFGVRLDAYELKTPAKKIIHTPTAALARLIAQEWNAQGDEIEPATMPVMRLVCTAMDRVALDPQATAEAFAAYGMSDLLFYRAPHPAHLVAQQGAAWDPILDWARKRVDMSFHSTQSILPIAQPEVNLQRFAQVASGDVFRLTGLAHSAALMGSAILALALDEAHITPEQAFDLAFFDDLFQIEEWGEDEEASDRLDKIKLEINRLMDYLSSLKSA
jgi:chaperone required for assembly of F1-ATPase